MPCFLTTLSSYPPTRKHTCNIAHFANSTQRPILSGLFNHGLRKLSSLRMARIKRDNIYRLEETEINVPG